MKFDMLGKLCCVFAMSLAGYVFFPRNRLYSTSMMVHMPSSASSSASSMGTSTMLSSAPATAASSTSSSLSSSASSITPSTLSSAPSTAQSTAASSTSGASFGGQNGELAIEQSFDRRKCFDPASFTVAFDLDRGLTDQRTALLHGFAVAYSLGAETVFVAPRLRRGVSVEVSLDQFYDTGIVRKILNTLNLTLLSDRPQNVQTVNLARQHLEGETMQWICSQVRDSLAPSSANIVVDLGSVAGLLRVDEQNLGLISFIDKHLEYNARIRTAAQRILGKLPTVFNGLHLDEAYQTVAPENLAPKMMQLGFERETIVFVASGVPMERLVQALQPYNIETMTSLSEFRVEAADEWDLDPINQLILEKAKKFTGFSLSNYSISIAGNRWLHEGFCDKSYDSKTFFHPWPSPMFSWRGALPFGPSCHDTDHSHTASHTVVPKRIVSETCRFIYFAGLESSGHAFWKTLLPNLNPSATWTCAVGPELYDGAHRVGYFSTYKESIRSETALRVVKLMADANKNLSQQGDGNIVLLNIFCSKKSGMQSYPNYGGGARSIQNPDVRALAKLAEQAQVDLRIVLIVRDPRNVVKSSLKRRLHAIKMYTSTLSLLRNQLDLLDPSFISCWSYDKPTANIPELLSFMGSRHDPTDFQNIIEKNFRKDHLNQATGAEASMPEAWGTLMATYDEVTAKYC